MKTTMQELKVSLTTAITLIEYYLEKEKEQKSESINPMYAFIFIFIAFLITAILQNI
jgi:hypothetical protein